MAKIKKTIMIFVLGLIMTQVALGYGVDILNTDPAPLKAGELADITVQLFSDVQEDDLTNVKLELEESNFIRIINYEDRLFSTFPSGRTVTKTYSVFIEEDLPEGDINLKFKLTSNEVNLDFEEKVFVESGDTLPELRIGKIKTVPQELLSDSDDNQITITLQNLGDKDAELVTATLNSEESVSASYSFSMQDSVSSVKSGEEKDLVFTIDLSEEAQGSIPSTLDLRYRTEASNEWQTINAKIPFEIDIIDSPLLKIVDVKLVDSFQGGNSENKVLVTIKNEGKEEAEEVRVRVVPDISYPFIFETTTQYVSSKIKVGETATVAFVAEVTSDAEDRNYAITTKLESLVGEARYTREDVLNIPTKSGKEIKTSSIAIGIIVTVILVAVIITWRNLKKK